MAQNLWNTIETGVMNIHQHYFGKPWENKGPDVNGQSQVVLLYPHENIALLKDHDIYSNLNTE